MRVWDSISLATALGSAATAGAFMTYSGFTTGGLRVLPPPVAMQAMQAINLAAPRSASFMALVFGTGALQAVQLTRTLLQRPSGSGWVVAASATYLVGVIGTTVVYHVPRNDFLADLNPATQSSEWLGWIASWVAVNHVRTLSAFAASLLLLGKIASPRG